MATPRTSRLTLYEMEEVEYNKLGLGTVTGRHNLPQSSHRANQRLSTSLTPLPIDVPCTSMAAIFIPCLMFWTTSGTTWKGRNVSPYIEILLLKPRLSSASVPHFLRALIKAMKQDKSWPYLPPCTQISTRPWR